MSEQRPRCSQIKPDGTPCQAYARPGRPTCVFHDPAERVAGQEARRRGARTRNTPAAVVPADQPDLVLETPADVIKLFADSINRIRKGTLCPKVGNAIGYLGSGLLKAWQTVEITRLAEQIEELKRQLARAEGDAP
jgi:hypothetical protein